MNAVEPIPLLVIAGPTASGKTALALQLAQQRPLEIVSADSRQVYRGMDIGTAKPTLAERARVPHHLLDQVDPDQPYTVADFVRQARPVIEAIRQRGHLPCVVGGTGLYIRALLGGLAETPQGDDALRQSLLQQEREEGPGTLYRRLAAWDPEQAQGIHPNNLVRIVRALEVGLLTGRRLSELQREHRFADRPYLSLMVGLDWPVAELDARIDQRAEAMLEDGLIEETACLLQRFPADSKALLTLGYRECQQFLNAEIDRAELLRLLRRNTRRYARRQLTWFRRESEMKWVASYGASGNIHALIDQFYDH